MGNDRSEWAASATGPQRQYYRPGAHRRGLTLLAQPGCEHLVARNPWVLIGDSECAHEREPIPKGPRESGQGPRGTKGLQSASNERWFAGDLLPVAVPPTCGWHCSLVGDSTESHLDVTECPANHETFQEAGSTHLTNVFPTERTPKTDPSNPFRRQVA